MTLPPDDGFNRPSSFDFGLANPGAAGTTDEPLTRRSARRAAVDSRSLAVPIIVALVVVAVVGGAAFAGWYLVKTSEDEVKADSAAFCSALAETPDALSQPGFGWPTDGADLATTLEHMKDFKKRWQAIAKVAPPTIKPDAKAVASAAAIVVKGIVDSKSIDRPTTLATMDAVTSKTAIPAWSAKYCS
jgi:hypothetical protein